MNDTNTLAGKCFVDTQHEVALPAKQVDLSTQNSQELSMKSLNFISSVSDFSTETEASGVVDKCTITSPGKAVPEPFAVSRVTKLSGAGFPATPTIANEVSKDGWSKDTSVVGRPKRVARPPKQ